MEEEFDDYDFDADKVKKAYAVEVDYELEVDGDEAVDESNIFITYKYEGKWYVLNVVDVWTLVTEMADEEYEDAREDMREELDN